MCAALHTAHPRVGFRELQILHSNVSSILMHYNLCTSHTYTQTHIHTYIHTHIYTYTQTHRHTDIHTLIYTYTHTLIYTQTHMCLCVSVCVYTLTCTVSSTQLSMSSGISLWARYRALLAQSSHYEFYSKPPWAITMSARTVQSTRNSTQAHCDAVQGSVVSKQSTVSWTWHYKLYPSALQAPWWSNPHPRVLWAQSKCAVNSIQEAMSAV